VRAELKGGKAEPEATISITPTVGSILFAPSGLTYPAFIYGMKISYDVNGSNIADSLGVEGTVNYFATPSQSGTASASAYLFRADAIYSLFPKKKWNPFAVIGLGEFLVNKDNSHEQSLLLNYGVGFKYMLEDYLALRVETRYISMYSSVNPRANFELSTGLTYIFGKEHKKKTPPAPLPKLKAIPDIEEKTILAPPATENAQDLSVLERLGAVGPAVLGIENGPAEFPAPPPPQLPPGALPRAFRSELREGGTTGWGAASPPQAQAAQAPAVVAPAPAVATPAPAQVSAPPPARVTAPAPPPQPPAAPPKGQATEPPAIIAPPPAPAVEAAPPAREPAAAPVTPEQAAPAPRREQPARKGGYRVVRYLTVHFDFSSAAVSPRYAGSLAAVAEMVRQAPASSIRIVGHTDNIGKSRPNLVLSLKRANNLKNQLVSLGVNPGQISTKGVGYTLPVASNLTSLGRLKNRRAVATIMVIAEP